MSGSRRRAKPSGEKIATFPSLLGSAEEAVGAMALAILDLGKLDHSSIRNEVQWSLDAASKKLGDATNRCRDFAQIVLTEQNKGMKDGAYDITPINALCAACGDYSLMLSVPGHPTGVAVCRTCSFPWPPPRRRKAS